MSRVLQRRPLLVELARFAVVGCVIATLNAAIFLVARTWWDPLPANLVAVVLSTAASTELNLRFTFRGPPARTWRTHLQTGLAILYYAFSGSAVLLALDLLAAGTTPAQEAAAVGASGVLAALARFLVMRHWVARPARGGCASRRRRHDRPTSSGCGRVPA